MNNLLLEHDDLVKYLKQAYLIEKEKFEANYLVQELQSKCNYHQNSVIMSRRTLEESHQHLKDANNRGGFTGFIVEFIGFSIVLLIPVYIGCFLLLLFTKFGDVLLGALTSYEGPNIFMDSLYPALCLSPIVGLVLSIKSSSEDNGRKHSDIRSARMNIERSENSLAYHEKFLRSYLPELNRAQNYLNSINRMSSEFYKTNYIHPNYRSLIPISSIFNYIETGQCSTLQGPNGAYRMYEQDALQGAIITRLDVVIEKMDQLISNQRDLIRAIKESQAAVSGVLNDIQSSVESMRESTYTTSYYQKKAYQEQKFQSDILFWNTFIL